MRTPLLLAAATAALILPAGGAAAFDPPSRSLVADSGASVRVHRERGGPGWRGDRREDWRDHRRGDGAGGYGFGYYYEPGQWARYNNRSWESDSFNDWWHERPNRSMPRWTQNNRRECKQQYWTSSGWTC